MSFLTPLLTSGLQAASKQIGLTLVSAGTQKLFNLIFSGSATTLDTASKKILSDLLDEVKSSQAGIEDIGKQIAGLQVDLKTDQVQEHVNAINTLFADYIVALDQLAQAANLELGEIKHEQYHKARGRCTDLGKTVKDSIHLRVVNIHTFIAGQGDKSLFNLVHEQAIRDSDFFAYYYRMKIPLLYYWAVEVKALALLQFVAWDRDVEFPGILNLIESVQNLIDAQEKHVVGLMPASVIQLAEALTNAGNGSELPKVKVIFQSEANKNVVGDTNNGGCRTDMVDSANWVLQPVEPLLPLDVNKDHHFVLTYAGLSLTFTKLWQGNNPSNPLSSWDALTSNSDPFKVSPSWKIRPSKPSSQDKFRLQFYSPLEGITCNGHVLVWYARSDGHFLGKRDDLNENYPGQFFILKLA